MIFVFRQRTLENTEGKSKKAIQRKWQHRVHKTKKNKTQYVLDTTMGKQTQITRNPERKNT